MSKLNEILSKVKKKRSMQVIISGLLNWVWVYDVRHRKWVLLGQATENLWGFIGLV